MITRLNMLKAKEITTLICVALLAVTCGCGKKAGGPAAMPPPQVTVSQPVQHDVTEWDEYPGRLEAVEEVEVRARVSGYLQSINFKDGAEVKKGDLLFTIDPRSYQAELDRAKGDLSREQTRLDLAINDAQRAERLLKSKAASEEEADSKAKAQREAEAALVSGKAAVEMAQINIDFTRITSPIDGRIGRRMITEGNLVNGNQGQSTLLTTIVSLDPVYVYFDVYEQSALKYQKLLGEKKLKLAENGKLPAELELANETDFPHKGYIDFIANQLDFRTGTLRMRAIFPNPRSNRVLEPGYFGRIRVPGSAEYKAIMITDQAIGTDQAQKFVYTLTSSNTAAYRPIKLGPLIDGLRVVYQGLQPNDKVIVNGLMSVRPGGPVKPQEAPMPGEKKSAMAER